MKLGISIFLIFLSISCYSNKTERISNDLVEVIINADGGFVDINNLVLKQNIISESFTGFTARSYIDLKDLGRIGVETEEPETSYSSKNARNSVSRKGGIETAFINGESISLKSYYEGIGELEVQFTLYPDSAFAEIGFSFKNFQEKPLRLVRINVLDGYFMPGRDHDGMIILPGNSGAGNTNAIKTGSAESENNILCFFSGDAGDAALVAGGLTYKDFRKHVIIEDGGIVLFAEDAVGRRIDPGNRYVSEDRFYVNGIGSNPFEALELYACISKMARGIDLSYYTFPSTCMWFLSVTHFGADATSENSSSGAVKEMEIIKKSGFLKYTPVAVRLVPDNYEQNNEQGWWDDEHWQFYGRKYRCVVDHHYKKPYETTKKWAGKVIELGGIPLTYFQPGIRSEDYADSFPGHMLYNESRRYIRKDKRVVSDPHTLMGIGGIPDLLNPNDWIDGYGKLYAESYDYTDPGFLDHWKEVNLNLKNGGVKGVFYDYPDRAFPQRGGLEDRYATATHAYRNVFRLAREMQGPYAYLQERIGPGSDATLEFVSSVRTEGDTNVINTAILNKAANRWYKNRLLTNYDMDGKALVEAGYGQNRYKIGSVQRKSILTLSYAVSGRLLLTESFSKFSDEVLHDLSRIFPFHSSALSPRPLHAFHGGMPVLDFKISENWHQLILYNDSDEDNKFKILLGGKNSEGSPGLNQDKSYYMYDFWNDSFLGIWKGSDTLVQNIDAGESRVISIHTVEDNPQWISTNRHIMQGYVDLAKKPEWDGNKNILSGISKVIGGEIYKITLALNGYVPGKVKTNNATAEINIREDNRNLADIFIKADKNTEVEWEMTFEKNASKAGDKRVSAIKNFSDLIDRVPRLSVLAEDGYYVWGGSAIKGRDGLYHLYYSRWKKEFYFSGWVTHSEIAHAVSNSAVGPFSFKDVALPPRGAGFWDGLCTHNPHIKEFEGKYYLYYMGNTGDGIAGENLNFTHRNNQRIGVAWANDPYGPWHRMEKPLVDISDDPSADDALMTSNPGITRMKDGKYLIVYKAVGKQFELPFGGPVTHLAAIAESPLGPISKLGERIFYKDGEKFPAEDPFIWYNEVDGIYYGIVKDMHGIFTGEGVSLALFESNNGLDWHPAKNPLASKLEITWEDGKTQKLARLERAQILFENGRPVALYCAASYGDPDKSDTFNIHIPLKSK